MKTQYRPLYERISKLQRRYRPENRIARGMVDAAPLADIALLVFLFFLASSSFILQPGITVELPASEFTGGARYGGMVVTISQEGMIFFNDERTPREGLASAFSQAVHDNPDGVLVIEADSRVRNSTLVDIYNTATASGIKEAVLATRVSSPDRP
ncbi:MAG: biopolymer transporter ExbD [Spartobacteria bacterium]|nr:biopolymer transporter ExbD [Spartobacteria bacterium]